MDERRDPIEPAPPPVPRRPGEVTAVLVVVVVAAVANAVFGLLLLTQVDAARALLLQNAEAQGTSAAGLEAVLVAAFGVIVVLAVVYAAALIALAALFRAGRPWARAALFSISFLSLFALAVPTAPAIAVILLLLVADVLMYRAPVSAWVRALRGLRPA